MGESGKSDGGDVLVGIGLVAVCCLLAWPAFHELKALIDNYRIEDDDG